MKNITIATMSNAGDTLIFIAEEQKYFALNGLIVTQKTYNSGLAATDAMLTGEADLSYATEFIVVGNAMEKQRVSIVTTYSKNETVSIAGFKESGIQTVADLKGKRIGLSLGTINEFYLGRLLSLNGMARGEVTFIDVKLPDLLKALNSRHVDAVVAGSRNLFPIIQQKEKSIFLWPAHSTQPAFGTLVGDSSWITGHEEALKGLLKSMSEAEEYVNHNPDKAKAVVQKRLKYDDEYMKSVWSEYQFSLSLDQSLIIAMEDEARWMIGNKMTTAKTVPNFLDFIYADGLKSVKPEAMKIAGK